MSEPSDADLVHGAWRLMAAGNARGAVTQLKSVLARDPNREDALTALCQAHLYLGDLTEGQAVATALLRVAPNAAVSHRLQAEIYRRQGETWRAIESARRAVKLDPCTTGQFFAEIGEPVCTSDVIAYDEFKETRFYKEWARRIGRSPNDPFAKIPTAAE